MSQAGQGEPLLKMSRSDERSALSRTSGGSCQIRRSIVGTAKIQSTRCFSMSSSTLAASKRSISTIVEPVKSPLKEKVKGPLWYSGPGTSCTPSICIPMIGAVGSTVAGGR